MCKGDGKGFCEGRSQYSDAEWQAEGDILPRLATLWSALHEAQSLPGWDPAKVITADCGYRGIHIHLNGDEDLGYRLAARLLPTALCRTQRTHTEQEHSAPDEIVSVLNWYGMYAGQALNVTSSWRTPLVERDLTADELAVGVAEGWADPENDPADIDWPTRQANALIPFTVVAGRPCIPGASTGIHRGRNEMGRWGESAMADALVTADLGDGQRWLLLIWRGDGHGWAVPGGGIEAGETPVQAASRELAEETGLGLPADAFTPFAPRLVPDPRASDEAWAVTVISRTHLNLNGLGHGLPEVTGSDDARRAEWIRANSYADMVTDLRARFAGAVFPAHVEFLSDFLQ
ncbi:hypothetical protein GCM10022223_46850 [Kineosporia mesophila]|uniref:Nudix hydrolase domain-containing protein n=1 Tax=Kineosporia mesophila TaxID=566012 RepID=A0ABP7A3T2_9ACTN|nr:NUDIX hydrolase [Kineosporia mesophila]MCD5353796.1 NUDIX hydrolase [Kineosporia mesophila]